MNSKVQANRVTGKYHPAYVLPGSRVPRAAADQALRLPTSPAHADAALEFGLLDAVVDDGQAILLRDKSTDRSIRGRLYPRHNLVCDLLLQDKGALCPTGFLLVNLECEIALS